MPSAEGDDDPPQTQPPPQSVPHKGHAYSAHHPQPMAYVPRDVALTTVIALTIRYGCLVSPVFSLLFCYSDAVAVVGAVKYVAAARLLVSPVFCIGTLLAPGFVLGVRTSMTRPLLLILARFSLPHPRPRSSNPWISAQELDTMVKTQHPALYDPFSVPSLIQVCCCVGAAVSPPFSTSALPLRSKFLNCKFPGADLGMRSNMNLHHPHARVVRTPVRRPVCARVSPISPGLCLCPGTELYRCSS